MGNSGDDANVDRLTDRQKNRQLTISQQECENNNLDTLI